MHNSSESEIVNTKPALIKFAVFLRPRLIAFSGVFILVLLGLTYLKSMAGINTPLLVMAFSDTELSVFYSVSLLSSLWVAMAIAMMLPTAVPMISAYVQICETATTKSIKTVSPFVLIAGYVCVWLVFALGAAVVQVGLLRISLQFPQVAFMQQGAASLLLVSAGAYQFTGLKQACLAKCRAPLNFFFANWSDRTKDIFKLGLNQGLFCLGCCWALMLLMFVSGIMNIMWMVALAVLMVIEKTLPKPDGFRRITGFALIAWGAMVGIGFLIT
jgi:predicted metal-binding membrane protein